MSSDFHIAVTAHWSESEMLFNLISLLLNDWSFSSLSWLTLFCIRSVSDFHYWCVKLMSCQLWSVLLLLLFIILIWDLNDSVLQDTFFVISVWVNETDVLLSSWYSESDWWDWWDCLDWWNCSDWWDCSMRSTDFDETILKLFKSDKKVSTKWQRLLNDWNESIVFDDVVSAVFSLFFLLQNQVKTSVKRELSVFDIWWD